MSLDASGYTITTPIEGSPYPVHLTFIPSLDELYVPVILRKPEGPGPFPLITMGRGDGRGRRHTSVCSVLPDISAV